jgi:N utilization substance protein B
MGKRRKARELALKILYKIDFTDYSYREALNIFYNNFNISNKLKDFVEILVKGVQENKDVIDKYIVKFSENWRIDRISDVDRNILRMAIFELLYLSDIPPKVTINEAIEISKIYGSDESFAFINGILDKFLKEIIKPDKILLS